MKKRTFFLIGLMAAIAVSFCFTACSGTKNKLVGQWTGETQYSSYVIDLKADGTFFNVFFDKEDHIQVSTGSYQYSEDTRELVLIIKTINEPYDTKGLNQPMPYTVEWDGEDRIYLIDNSDPEHIQKSEPVLRLKMQQ